MLLIISFIFQEKNYNKTQVYLWKAWIGIHYNQKCSLKETIGICVNSLFQNIDAFEGLDKTRRKELLQLAKKKSHFLFNEC